MSPGSTSFPGAPVLGRASGASFIRMAVLASAALLAAGKAKRKSPGLNDQGLEVTFANRTRDGGWGDARLACVEYGEWLKRSPPPQVASGMDFPGRLAKPGSRFWSDRRGLAHAGDFVAAEIVHNDDVAGL